MSFNLNKVPVVGKMMGGSHNQGQRASTPMYQITDIGRKRLHGMASSGPELVVLQILAMRSYPISSYEILNAAGGQMDKDTLRVALTNLLGNNCVQRPGF